MEKTNKQILSLTTRIYIGIGKAIIPILSEAQVINILSFIDVQEQAERILLGRRAGAVSKSPDCSLPHSSIL